MKALTPSNRIGRGVPSQLASQAGMTLLDVVIIVAILGLSIALVSPALIAARDRARRWSCANNLRAIGTGLRQYHDTHGTFPAAATWQPGPMATLMLNEAKRIDLITRENWAISLLPFLGEDELSLQFDLSRPIMAEANALPSLSRPGRYICPMDSFNRPDNPYTFLPEGHTEPLATFARGNYGINGGTHNPRFTPETAAEPRGDGLELVLDSRRRLFQLVGTGIAGINRAFRTSDFSNGQSTLVAVEELRAGIHPLDPRGVWALGQIGGSITWGHGVAGDAGRPNNQWPRSDDILGCQQLHIVLGSETLTRERMPCVDYVDRNDQAASRSLHEQGVNVLFVDGQVRFIHNQVNAGVWHVMHSRETPEGILADDFDAKLAPSDHPPEASPERPPVTVQARPGTRFENSLGMKFVVIPSGEFEMGLPDLDHDPPPPECPVHRVRITRPFCLGRFEVTRGEYRAISSSEPVAGLPREGNEDDDRLPQTEVSWDDAVQFCRKLAALPAEAAAKRHYRLPTEAEWEFACRGGQSVPYAWNRERAPGDASGENAGMKPALPLTPVGSYPANALGLCDMRGNAWEWCSDWFDRGYYRRSPVDDPQGPATGHLKVVRGGDWIFVGELCRINYPIMPPWKKNPYVGFRVVCETTGGEE